MKGAANTANNARMRTALLLLLSAGLAHAADTADSTRTADMTRHRLVIVSIPDRKLAVVSGGEVLRVFPVSVGSKSSPSPVGAFRLINRITNPGYYRPGVVIPSGPGNPLGPRWLGLNKKSYGIHGTNAPRSIGKAVSHGCIRLRNPDIVRLFSMLQVGDLVEIHGERDSDTIRAFGEPAEDGRAEQGPATLIRPTTAGTGR